MKSKSLAFKIHFPSFFLRKVKNIFKILETFFVLFDRIVCYTYYDFPEDCDQCKDNKLCLVLHIADLENANQRKFQALFNQQLEIQWLKRSED